MPRIYQQIDWSNGGDGIVCRRAIKSVADLRGKTVVLAQNSPSHFFLLNTLISGGAAAERRASTSSRRTLSRRPPRSTPTSRVACAVSWAPDIYNLAEASGQQDAREHADGEQAHRRRVVRARRLRQGQPADHRRARARDLRGDGSAQGAGREGAGREAHGRPATRSRRRTRSRCSATRTRRTTPRTASSS